MIHNDTIIQLCLTIACIFTPIPAVIQMCMYYKGIKHVTARRICFFSVLFNFLSVFVFVVFMTTSSS